MLKAVPHRHWVFSIPKRLRIYFLYDRNLLKKLSGLRKKAGRDNDVPALMDAGVSRKGFRKNWARLVQKIYEVDPLICPKCQGKMKIIAIIDQYYLIKKILKYLGLWLRNHDPPKKKTKHIPEVTYDDLFSQVPQDDYWIQHFPE